MMMAVVTIKANSTALWPTDVVSLGLRTRSLMLRGCPAGWLRDSFFGICFLII
jgi:hypothetical protein